MKHLFIPLIALLLFASCAEENMPEFATGYLQITSLEARIGEVETESVTRTVSPELNVDICDETGTEIIVSLPAGEIYNPLKLEAGNYLLKAYSSNYQTEYDNTQKGDAKFYKEEKFTVVAGKMCRLAVEVPMTNFGVQLVLPDAFGEWFPTYTFTLTLGSRTLALQNGETAYFELPANEEQLTYQLSATNQDGEIFNENVRSLESTAIGTVYKITYSLSQNRLSQFSASFTH